MRLLWLFVALPIVEIALFIQVGGLIGVWATLGLVVLAAVLGMAVIRSQGAHAWMEAQQSLAQLRDPSRPLAHGMMLMIAGALLIVPGFFTDTIGLLLLIPPVRDLVMRQAGRRMRVRSVHVARRESHRPPYADGVIDADFVVEDTPPRPRPPLDLPEDGTGDRPARRGGSGWTRH
ncbi:FxsA family protein [Paracoccus sp. YIM 132242]|uniref:FxsA family protein n=1 Tax=Paracoccus lichenicola TaxID=2665644 RepID=A0A6L6HQS7_9RHOB|nr:FxsA family protein [Paracoccus lichenicola]MTE00691.1 FxsA family protein [Paracoccus lichenicola]